jgi:HEAT repeat protein
LGDLGDRLASRELELALREDEYPDVRAAAAWALGVLARETSLINLLQALDEDDDETVRAAAATALRHYPDAPLEPVMAALQDPDLVVALAAVQTLGAWGRPEAEEPLMRSLEQGGAELRAAAARALGELTPPPRQALLQALVEEDQPSVQQALLGSLSHLGPDPYQQEQLELWYERASSDERLSLLRLLPASGCDALPLLRMGALVEEDIRLCLEAIHVCGALAPEELREPLTQLALRDESSEVRAAAREALGYYPPEAVLDLLIDLLQQDPLTEAEAVMGALMAQGEAAVTPLIVMRSPTISPWATLVAVAVVPTMARAEIAMVAERGVSRFPAVLPTTAPALICLTPLTAVTAAQLIW